MGWSKSVLIQSKEPSVKATGAIQPPYEQNAYHHSGPAFNNRSTLDRPGLQLQTDRQEESGPGGRFSESQTDRAAPRSPLPLRPPGPERAGPPSSRSRRRRPPAHPPRPQLRCALAPENRREGAATHRLGRSRRLCRRRRGGSRSGGSAFPPPASPWTVPPPAAPPSPASRGVSLLAAADPPPHCDPAGSLSRVGGTAGVQGGPGGGARFAGAVDAPPVRVRPPALTPRCPLSPSRGPGF
uniref:protein PRRC2A-like n=1 Tax=Odobenus rosmarus divergens TaxID=9708 RepID=UPI00063CBA65|nr:PREDICTED: protein PRRC2A-like [Odobenus rosmarus divergens]